MKKLFLFLMLAFSLVSCGNKQKEQQTQSPVETAVRPKWVYDAVIYEVNTRQFTNEGTFNAFAEHLPRLNELGVDILWFMPIQTIGEKDRKGTLGSYYSIKDYKEVNAEFGTLDDFKNVVQQAHQLGMKVILDWVGNHTSRDAVWVEEHPDWYKRDSLGNITIMYDWTDIGPVDYENADMRAAMMDAMLFWVREADIDGFRCDVAGEVPTDFWKAVTDSLKTLKPDIFMLAEAEKPELNDNGIFDAYYAWDFHHKMNMVAQGKENVDSLRLSLKRMNERFAPEAIPMYFTSNHDENSWNGTEFERMGDAAEAFAALTYVLPGMPLIYNGQEVGLDRRLAFFEKDSIVWEDKANFTDFYASMNAFKKANPALLSQNRGGIFTEIENNQPQKIFSFRRVKDGNEIVSVFNLSKDVVEVSFSEKVPGIGFSGFNNEVEEVAATEWKLQPWEYRIFYKK